MPTHICDLPNGMTSLIFEALPLSSVRKCREVCKEWNSLITLPEFSPLISSQFENQNSPKPMLVENDYVKGCSIRLYLPSSNSWVPMSIPNLMDPSQKGPLYLTASSGGLMCFETHDRKSFIIYNPITNKRRFLQLPVSDGEESVRLACSCLNPTFCVHSQHNMPNTLTGLIVDTTSSSYKLIVASLDENTKRRTFIYNSLKGSWTIGAQVPEGKGFVNPVALSVKGNLYCLIQGSVHKTVGKYDAKHDIWYCSPSISMKNDVSMILYEIQDKYEHIQEEYELIEQDGGVKLLFRRVERDRYGTFSDIAPLHYSKPLTLSVVHTCAGAEVQEKQWSLTEEKSDQIISSNFDYTWVFCTRGGHIGNKGPVYCTQASAYSASCTGHDNIIYTFCNKVTKRRCNKPSMFHVVKINCNICCINNYKSCCIKKIATLLPGVRREDSHGETQIELRLFEPSLTAQV